MADQGSRNAVALLPFADHKLQAGSPLLDVAGLKPRSLQARHGPHIRHPLGHLERQAGAVRIVDVDHCAAQARPAKQRSLGLPVLGHAAVVIQVVLREIGEDGAADLGANQAPFGQTDGRGFDGAGLQAGLDKLAKALLQQHRIGCSQTAWLQGRAVTLGQRYLPDAQGADQPTGHGRVLEARQGLGQPPSARGLAVGARDGHHRELC